MAETSVETRVGLVVPLQISLPPQAYGGIERDAQALLEGREDDITFKAFTSGDSIVGNLAGVEQITVCDQSLRSLGLTNEAFLDAEAEARSNLTRALSKTVMAGEIDVIHFLWEDYKLAQDTFDLPARKIYSFSNTPNSSNSIAPAIVNREPGSEKYHHCNALSYTHARALNAAVDFLIPGDHASIEVMPYGVSFEGIEPSCYRLSQSPEPPKIPLLQTLQANGNDYIVHIAGINRVKGQLSSIALFRQARLGGARNLKLVIAGGPDGTSDDAKRYAKEVEALSQEDDDIFYFGEANEQQKWGLFRFALGSLYCSSLEDPDYVEAFCRAIAESAGSGTPVLGGFGSDTFKELVENDVTGLEAKDIKEAAQLVSKLYGIDRVKCAMRARETMNADRYTKQMMSLYRYLGRGYPLPVKGAEGLAPALIYSDNYTPYSNLERAARVHPQEWYNERFGEAWFRRQQAKWYATDPDLRGINRAFKTELMQNIAQRLFDELPCNNKYIG